MRPVVCLLVWLLLAPAAASSEWVRPVGGPVVDRFAYDRSRPFAPDARRVVRLAAPAGARVRAACGGPVAFAGRLPHWGGGVTVLCGGWRVSHLGLARIISGGLVGAGEVIGTAGRRGVLVGVRRARDRWGFVDPEAFLPRRSPPAGPAPVLRPTPRRPDPPSRPAPPSRAGMPWPAWAGAGLLVAALPGLRRRRRPARLRHDAARCRPA